jgi:hypothetical protein
MALIKCKECGKEISNEAEACPHCGKKNKKAEGLGCGTLIVVLIGGFILMSCLGGSSSNNSKSGDNSTSSQSSTNNSEDSTTVSIKADIRSSASEVMISNQDKFPWTEVTIYLNDLHILGSNFTYKIRTLRPGQTSTIPLIEFTTGDGTRFNPAATKVQRYIISCKTPKGDGAGSWGGSADN